MSVSLGTRQIGLLLGATFLLLGGVATVQQGAVTGFLTADASVDTEQVRDEVTDMFEARGIDASVESVTSASDHLYKVIVNTGDEMTKVYVTKDGIHLVQNPVTIDSFIERVQQRNDFLTCLENNKVQIVGRTSLNATRQQIQLLGGARGLEDVYVEASNTTINKLVRSDVEVLPVTVYNGTFYEGVKRPSFYGQLVGCQYPQ